MKKFLKLNPLSLCQKILLSRNKFKQELLLLNLRKQWIFKAKKWSLRKQLRVMEIVGKTPMED
jgi:hypothetical protein